MVRDDPRLVPSARKAITDAEKVHWSLISIWEIAIKVSLKRPGFQLAPGWSERIPREMTLNGFHRIPLAPLHFETLSKLPFPHRDSFDRILIATAMAESLGIVTDDRKFKNYQVELIW